MLLSEICIKRPVFATVLNLVIVALGAIFFTKLQIRGTPDISVPIINVEAHYAGADALYMEQEITTRIEKALKTVKNLDYITSQSSTGESSITLSFLLSTDIEVALNDVRAKISDITYMFPQDMKAPSVAKLDADNFPSLFISVESDQYSDLELTKIVEDNLQTPLDKLESVGQSQIYGGREYIMRIEPDSKKLYQHKISLLEIESAIKEQNKDYPAGTIKTKSNNFIVTLEGSLSTPEEFGNIILKVQNGGIIKLRDIAKISLTSPDEDIIFRYNGKSSIALGLIKESKANVIDLSHEVTKALERIKESMPKGISMGIAYDGATPVKASIYAVFQTIFEALILVVLVTYLFLASARITLIPFVTIPVSLIGTFSLMYAFGFSINIFTLLAMILAIGLVVDDAIVMLENIFRYNEMGHKPMEAAMLASKEIGFAIIAMTITLAAVFLPVGFIEGFIGKLFIEFAWTLAFCVLFSGFVALTLTPMMSSRMVTKHNTDLPKFLVKFNDILKFIQNKYIYYLKLTFDNKKKFVIIIASSFIVLIISFKFTQKIFVPQEDDGFLQVSLKGPEGSNLESSTKVVKEAEKILANYKDILGYLMVIGAGGSDNVFGFIPLKNWGERSCSQETIKNMLNKQFSEIPGMSICAMDPRSMVSGNARSPIEFTIQTNLEYDDLDKISQQFIDIMKTNPIFLNVNRNLQSAMPTISIEVNRDKAYLYGMDLANIGKTVQYLLAGQQLGHFRMSNDLYDVILQFNQKDRKDISDFSKILIRAKNNNMLPLELIANITEKISVKSYNHYNNSKSVTISSDLAPDGKIDDAINEINKIAAKLLDPSNTIIEYIGEIKQMREADSNMLITFVFALIFIYLVLAAQFESFTDPLLILLAVPFSITGGVLALWLAGNSLNMYSNIGLITLIGLITKNSIMIVEFANQLRAKGVKVQEAIIESSKLRLRPILMTTLAAVVGALPLVFADGAGAAARNSIGFVIVGGLSIGTIFTIFVIPVIYQTFKKD
ncbi:hydrogenase expression protein HypA [Rickettsia conorii subsp. heilongjiangensis]|uniref:Hydrogenase expression protein HypA n=1 Tax=Rickettsia conorii subsp. heilongjiangensis TaxID=226665 RepID=A0AAD1GI48_RICCR|nr:efflux RND transporter permease subunit [Rickettsia conorii]AEK74254.1 acriflavin resistance protein D [Rickettsia conorii subsp. heilongjiangensis 054]BBM91045.1 hydrogenase expression protein HypA [Rickettsia conorii subsp. heilongjiangensis]BBM92254.1 hydrogenase expression protein HypA [Rickettsia conorii subsp. heilongjiangensis]BBM93463.1 hydrogenase expression protein HypA [Rickettsia conorii subsp. heilongjiangensis]BBM94672.1 hydrogenase expression protein HypA [Rickettsia conorii 